MGLLNRIFSKKKKNKDKKEIPKKNLKKPKINSKNKKTQKKAVAKIEKKKTLTQEKKTKEVKLEIERKAGKKEKKEEFLKTFIPGFDELIREGIPMGSTVLVEGGPGSGKTIFCLNIAKNMCQKGKKILYMSFEEPEERLKKHMKNFGWDIESYEKKGLFYIKRFNALDIARSVEALLSEAKKELLIEVQPVLIPPDFQPDIVLIDSLSSISSAFSGEENRFRIYMEQLFRYLEGHHITSFLIREISSPSHVGGTFVEKGEAVSFLSDGIVVLYNVFYEQGIRKRAIEVLKIRGVEINRKVVEYEIKRKKGIVVYPNKILKGKYVLT